MRNEGAWRRWAARSSTSVLWTTLAALPSAAVDVPNVTEVAMPTQFRNASLRGLSRHTFALDKVFDDPKLARNVISSMDANPVNAGAYRLGPKVTWHWCHSSNRLPVSRKHSGFGSDRDAFRSGGRADDHKHYPASLKQAMAYCVRTEGCIAMYDAGCDGKGPWEQGNASLKERGATAQPFHRPAPWRYSCPPAAGASPSARPLERDR